MTMLNAALGLARVGYRVVPLPPGMKSPPPKDWPSLATKDADAVSRWWTKQPDANIAIVGGNGLLIVDVDPRHGGDLSLSELQSRYGALPATLTARTPRGGMHLYFGGSDVANRNGKIGDGIDIKSQGGYVVAPPSRTIAIPGKQHAGCYEWIDVRVAPAMAPPWLIGLVGATTPASSKNATAFKLRCIEGEQLADLSSALAHLATVPDVANNSVWTEIGYALLSLGDQGREIFCEWSIRAPGYAIGAPERWWDSHQAGSARSDYRHVYTLAKKYGWVNPRSRAAQIAVTTQSPADSGTVSTLCTPSHVMTLDRRNRYEATIENLVCILSSQPRTAIGYDEFKGRVMIARDGGVEWQPLTDTDMIQLRETLAREQRFAPISKELMRDALQLVADRRKFDSAIVWLGGLSWDGVPRIERFLATHCGATDDDYSRAVSLYMWTGLAGRVLDPGCQLDMVVALQSPQGRRKSTGLQALVHETECFTDGLTLHEDDDDFKRLIRGKLVVEIAELAGLSRADINVVKRTITRRTEEWIEKWQTLPTRYKRRCMLFATTNEERFLPPDETGQRRWLPVEVAELDPVRIVGDRLQLWAEGAMTWRQRGVLYAEAERLAAGRHHQYEATDVWETEVERWLNTPTQAMPGQPPLPPPGTRPLALSEVLAGALCLNAGAMDSKAEKRAARVLRQLGYERRDIKIEGKAQKRWVRR